MLRRRRAHDLVFHFTPARGTRHQQLHPHVESTQAVKLYLVHFVRVSGHIRLGSRFPRLGRGGYKVYTRYTWTSGSVSGGLLTEIEKRGVGHPVFRLRRAMERLLGEYWKITVHRWGTELKQRSCTEFRGALTTKVQ